MVWVLSASMDVEPEDVEIKYATKTSTLHRCFCEY